MKSILLIMFGLLLIGCHNQEYKPTWCDKNTEKLVRSLKLGTYTKGPNINPDILRLFRDCKTYHRYFTNSLWCYHYVTFSKTTKHALDWEYYYEIDRDCNDNGRIIGIFNDGKYTILK